MDVLWIGLAYILGLAVSYVRVPPLVGYLGAGFLLASFGFEGVVIAGIAHLGVLFLLFTVGLNLRFKNIWRPEVLGAGSIHLFISGVIFFAAALGFGYGIKTGRAEHR